MSIPHTADPLYPTSADYSAMYVLPRALESAWSSARKRAYLPIVPFGETILGAGAMAMVMDAYKVWYSLDTTLQQCSYPSAPAHGSFRCGQATAVPARRARIGCSRGGYGCMCY